jgi:Na+:H+ antiporter
VDVTGVLLDILVVLVAAKVAAEIAERIGLPAVVLEILAGVIIGPSVLDFVGNDETLRVLGELGVILLLLQVGMEMDLGELAAVGRASVSVAVVGVAVPMASGFLVMTAIGESSNTALFLGAALAATSVGITARVFSDLRALASVEARTVLGAAVADDVLGLVILTVVVRIVSEGTVSVLDVLGIVGVALAFLVVSAALGSRAAPALFHWLHANARSAGTLVAIALAFTLAFAELADAAQLAPIVGAFVAGLSLSRSSARDRIARELGPVGHLFIPVFFLQIGIDAQVEKFVSPDVLGIAGLLLVVAVIGKLVASVGAVGAPGDKWLIGFGMLPRGEVGLIFATIGLQEGVLGRDLYAALLLVVLITTLMAPPLLKSRLLRMRRTRAAVSPAGSPEPAGGWLEVDDGTVELRGEPAPHLALSIGLDAALLLTEGNRPSSGLLDWLGSLGDTPLRWDDRATARLFEVLRKGSGRAWRFLDTTGLLTRAIPELAEAVARRRADPFLVDPSHVLRFETVDMIHELTDPAEGDPGAAREYAALEHPEWLLLAALTLDAAGTAESPVALARRLANRLDLGAAAEEELALLIGESGLLRAASAHIDGLTEQKVWQIATHLDRPERARALYVLTLALDDLPAWDRKRLDELLELVLVLLEQPALTGIDARNLVERRRQEALRAVAGRRDLTDRIRFAPPAYLLAQDAADVARQVDLVEPVPPPGQVRVRVHLLHAEGAVWRLEVACRDRPGLLATVSGVVAGQGFDIVEAFATTWPDGGALESFRLLRAPGSEGTPDATELRDAIVAAFDRPLRADPDPGAAVSFDDVASPWYTLCEVECPDRPGLLHALTVALARGGADVHSARVATTDGVAFDRFELTDRNGRKLDESTKSAIVDAVVGGVTDARRSPLRFARRRALRD